MIERIKKIIEYEQISVRAFELKIGASNGLIRKAIANNTDIQGKWLSIIADNYPHISTEWLLTGKGEMIKNSQIQIKPVDNEWLLHRFEEVIAENALLKKENEELKLSRGASINTPAYNVDSEKINTLTAAEPAHTHRTR